MSEHTKPEPQPRPSSPAWEWNGVCWHAIKGAIRLTLYYYEPGEAAIAYRPHASCGESSSSFTGAGSMQIEEAAAAAERLGDYLATYETERRHKVLVQLPAKRVRPAR